jgi:hypothetical protein
MRTLNALIIGLCIVVGLAAHAYISRPAEPSTATERQRESEREVQKRMLDVRPQSIPAGNQTLVSMPRIGFHNGQLDVNYDLFRYEDGKLIRVPLQ